MITSWCRHLPLAAGFRCLPVQWESVRYQRALCSACHSIKVVSQSHLCSLHVSPPNIRKLIPLWYCSKSSVLLAPTWYSVQQLYSVVFSTTTIPSRPLMSKKGVVAKLTVLWITVISYSISLAIWLKKQQLTNDCLQTSQWSLSPQLLTWCCQLAEAVFSYLWKNLVNNLVRDQPAQIIF